MNSLKDFVDYVWSFYGEHDETLYPIKGLTLDHIFQAWDIYKLDSKKVI